jgi:uncharacterized protein YaeQ
MSFRYSFRLESEGKRDLPSKIIIGRRHPETIHHVLLKLVGYLLFFRERLQIEPRMDDEDIPFVPDLLQLDYALRPALWVECGDCSVAKLDRLAVKAHEAEIWAVKRSFAEAEQLLHLMDRSGLRRDRYSVVGLDSAMFDELCGLLEPRNQVYWIKGAFDPPIMQFEFNGLWFDASFGLWRF